VPAVAPFSPPPPATFTYCESAPLKASAPLAEIDWGDRNHAFLVVLIAGIATMLYQPLGFILTMSLLVFTLLMVVERKNVLRAAAYSVGLTMVAWWVFGTALKSPLETGILGF